MHSLRVPQASVEGGLLSPSHDRCNKFRWYVESGILYWNLLEHLVSQHGLQIGPPLNFNLVPLAVSDQWYWWVR